MKKLFTSNSGIWKPKNPHSLDYLKYLHTLLAKHATVTEHNRGMLVEALRAISEILIWGDQNDSTVFDFFLEKQMLSYFLKIMKQKCGASICVQLLQTLNILFENIRHETSLYFLLSNNHVNSIITHRFDFSNEEVMAYYISFLKTLSFKLNNYTIHFFFNEQTNDFPLYTEAIKFFNHSEGMVRIAVRTLTLNVYKVGDPALLKFIRDKTAAPYFSNLVHFIANYVTDIDSYVHADEQSVMARGRLATMLAEHLDHIHYINDILSLDIGPLNEVLVDQLMKRLFVPLYLASLVPHLRQAWSTGQREDPPFGRAQHTTKPVALYLLVQVLQTIQHRPLIEQLLSLLLFGDADDIAPVPDPPNPLELAIRTPEYAEDPTNGASVSVPPPLSAAVVPPMAVMGTDIVGGGETVSASSSEDSDRPSAALPSSSAGQLPAPTSITIIAGGRSSGDDPLAQSDYSVNSTDELAEGASISSTTISRPIFASVLSAMDCEFTDHPAFYAMLILYAISRNKGVPSSLLEAAQLPGNILTEDASSTANSCDPDVLKRLVDVLASSGNADSRTRLMTVELCCLVLRQFVLASESTGAMLTQSPYYTTIFGAQDALIAQLVHFYQTDELFLDHFEDEYEQFQFSFSCIPVLLTLVSSLTTATALCRDKRRKHHQIKINQVSSDAVLLLSPCCTPLGGVEFEKRLPCGPQEHARKAIRVYFLLRHFILDLEGKSDTKLPLACPRNCVIVNDCLNLSNSDILSCTVALKNGVKLQRFLVTDGFQLILVEPDPKRLGWGVVRFVGFLQDVDMTGDKDDSRALLITILQKAKETKTFPFGPAAIAAPAIQVKLIFDDHIRCMAAKQRLTKGKQKARRYKLDLIGELLGVPQRTPQRSTPTSPPTGGRPVVPGYAALSSPKQEQRGGGSSRRTQSKKRTEEGIPLRTISAADHSIEITVVDDGCKIPDDPSNAASSSTTTESLKRPPIHDI